MGASLTHENFAAQLNKNFRVRIDEANAVDLVLADVSELKSTSRQEQFSIVFHGPLELFLGQGLREFAHDEMGEFSLFLVPIGKGDDSYSYEAVFNRLKK
ncbi:MAG TPA: hypothetical protein VIW64_01065 [Pyrinomonadaceae bacterium]|jgi:hypothetical protein